MSEIVNRSSGVLRRVLSSWKEITNLHEQFLDCSPEQHGIQTTCDIQCEETILGGWASRSRSVRVTVRTTRK